MPAVPVPFSPPLEDFVLPDQSRIVAAVRELLERRFEDPFLSRGCVPGRHRAAS